MSSEGGQPAKRAGAKSPLVLNEIQLILFQKLDPYTKIYQAGTGQSPKPIYFNNLQPTLMSGTRRVLPDTDRAVRRRSQAQSFESEARVPRIVCAVTRLRVRVPSDIHVCSSNGRALRC
mgnify:CR=1 FL=1